VSNYSDDDYLRLLAKYSRAERQLAAAVEALESIAANTCCDTCQEAALVARADERARVVEECAKVATKIKEDPFTKLASSHKITHSEMTAKDWMEAIADDIARAILALKAKGET